jgi:hypothetical protein
MNKFNKNKLPYEFMNFFHLLVPSIVIIQGFLQNHPSPFLNFAIKFNIRFIGSKTWNDIDESIKSLSKSSFKNNLKQQLIDYY